MRNTLIIAMVSGVVLTSVPLSEAAAQWSASAEVGATRFWGATAEQAPEARSFRPYRPTTFGVGVERWGRKIGIALRLQYSSASLALEGSDAVVAVKGVFDVYTAAPELVYRIARLGPGNQLRVHAGPVIDLWSFQYEESRVRVGGQAAVSLLVPLGARLAGAFRAGAALTSSPYNGDETLEGYERRALWRRSVSAGLQYRL